MLAGENEERLQLSNQLGERCREQHGEEDGSVSMKRHHCPLWRGERENLRRSPARDRGLAEGPGYPAAAFGAGRTPNCLMSETLSA
jgi:hypothetical protein